jgi:hypothetical protein
MGNGAESLRHQEKKIQKGAHRLSKQWRDIPGYEGLYLVSDCGEVVGLSRGLQRPAVDSYGYFRTALCKNGELKSFYVHRLVAMAFIQNPDNKPTVNHKNEDKTDNRVANLEWADVAAQNRHGTRMARANASRKIPVEQIDVSGNVVRRWPGTVDAVRELGLQKSSIRKCCKGQQKSCGGFIWRYA